MKLCKPNIQATCQSTLQWKQVDNQILNQQCNPSQENNDSWFENKQHKYCGELMMKIFQEDSGGEVTVSKQMWTKWCTAVGTCYLIPKYLSLGDPDMFIGEQ